jgi:hypothetical protein
MIKNITTMVISQGVIRLLRHWLAETEKVKKIHPNPPFLKEGARFWCLDASSTRKIFDFEGECT